MVCNFAITVVFTAEDKILIKNLVLLKDYSRRRLTKEFPNKGRKNGLYNLLRKIRATDSVDRRPEATPRQLLVSAETERH